MYDMDVRNNFRSNRLLLGDNHREDNVSSAGLVDEPSASAQTVFGVVILLAGLTGILGSGLALQALYRCKTLRNPKHYLTVNLCLTDGLLCVVYCPVTVWACFAHTWTFGEIGRNMFGFSVSVMTIVLMTTQLAIAVQRLTVAFDPLTAVSTITHGKMLMTAAFTWLYSILLMLPPLLGWNRFVIDETGVSVMFDYLADDDLSRAYVIAMLIIAFVLPLIGIIGSTDMHGMDVRNISDRLFLGDNHREDNVSSAGLVDAPSATAQTVFGVVILLAGLTGILGNGLALQALYACKALRNPKHYLVVNLCLTNGLLCLVYCPVTVWASFAHTWTFGEFGCDLVGFSVSVMTIVLMTTQLAIAVQRLIVAFDPLTAASTITHGKMLMTAAFTWLYSILLMLPSLLGWNRFIIDETGISVMFDYLADDDLSRAYVIALLIIAFVLPLIGIVCCYSYIFVALRRSRRNAKVPTSELTCKRDTKTAIVSLGLSALFCVSWTPYAMVILLSLCNITVPVTYVMVAAAIAKCASSIDPMMFALSLPVVRKYYKERLGKYLCGKSVKIRVSV
ncbi:OPN4 [Branchiostoma lanceolatum]|uniref:OPN4 protein n=1 Tax=Branchiostoma lanceolatum TaxID=7740 RepID=A0A8J9Z1W8_BRALA|nr:OPN4 [Branchiostoma lanceolatum]